MQYRLGTFNSRRQLQTKPKQTKNLPGHVFWIYKLSTDCSLRAPSQLHEHQSYLQLQNLLCCLPLRIVTQNITVDRVCQ